MVHLRLHDPSLSSAESAFREALGPAFTGLEDGLNDALYVDGTARLLRDERWRDVSELNSLMEMLERRVTLLGLLRAALTENDVVVRIETENNSPELRSVAVVAAAYGLPQRKLGTVSVVGPLRMDYRRAIRSVRDAAAQLSSFVADVYDER